MQIQILILKKMDSVVREIIKEKKREISGYKGKVEEVPDSRYKSNLREKIRVVHFLNKKNNKLHVLILI